MKENTAANDKFFISHFDYQEQGLNLKEIREAVKAQMGIEDDHIYRARLSALANPKRYGGKYVELRQFMKNQKPSIQVEVTTEKLESSETSEPSSDIISNEEATSAYEDLTENEIIRSLQEA